MTQGDTEKLFETVGRQITQQMGIDFSGKKQADLQRIFARTKEVLAFKSVEVLIQAFLNGQLNEREKSILIDALTIGETYFFREDKSFEVLEQIILPQLVTMKFTGDRRIRIWSAGCANGEEPYSIAILLHRMREQLKDFDVSLLATDINLNSLQFAVKGLYTDWSFRNTPALIKQRYFSRTDDGRYSIDPEIKKMVRFEYLNLADPLYPSLLNDTNAMDLIFCRNVLMYFSEIKAEEALKRLSNCLVDDGFFVVSACEIMGNRSHVFTPRHSPGFIFYQKKSQTKDKDTLIVQSVPMRQSMHSKDQRIKKVISKAWTEPVQVPSQEAAQLQTSRVLDQAKQMQVQGAYRQGEALLLEVIERQPDNEAALELLCNTYADQGRLEDALSQCQRLLTLNKLIPRYHFLNAMIWYELDELDKSAEALRRTLFLDNTYPTAYFMLGNLALQRGAVKEARGHFQSGVALLANWDKESIVPYSDGLRAGKMIELLQGILDGLQSGGET